MEDKKKLLDEALDRILSGPIGQRKEMSWDQSRWMKTNNIATSEDARKKMSKKAKQRCKDGWSNPNRYSWTVENNPNKGGLKGKDNPVYGTGARYKETTTGFIGTCYDMKQKWPYWMPQMVGRKRIRKDSHYPDKVWIKLDK